MSSVWTIEFEKAAAKELRKLDASVQREVVSYLETHIATDKNPRRFGKALRANLGGLWRYRVGDYRVVCKIFDEAVLVLVVRVAHRRESYR